jgi:hypothetical protein
MVFEVCCVSQLCSLLTLPSFWCCLATCMVDMKRPSVLPATQHPPRVTIDTATTLRTVFNCVIKTCKYGMLNHNLDLFIRTAFRKLAWSCNTSELSKYLWITCFVTPHLSYKVRATRSVSNQIEGLCENYFMNGVINFDSICQIQI